MTPTSMAVLVRHLRKIANPSQVARVSDAELLERFVHRRDQAAFELLVWRHQRLVLSVCRRALGDVPDAEDAFQATFLALARKASAVCRGEAVAGWLHTVAFRIALRARKSASPRLKTNVDLAALESPADPYREAARRDLAAVLDEEISRLPRKYRVPVMLCYLEGKTYAEAGRQLGVAIGTLAGQLKRARDLLQRRLRRRGIEASGALLAAVLCEQASSAAPAVLVNTTVKTAASLLLGETAATVAVSPTVAALAEGALRSLFVSKLKIGVVALLAGLLVTGIGLLIPAVTFVHPASPVEPEQPATEAALNKEESPRVDRYGDLLPDGALFRFGSMRMRHAGGIYNSALSPAGKILATASRGSVLLWDLAEGKVVRRLSSESSQTFCTPGLAFSPNGKYLAYVQDNYSAYLWDAKTGKEIARFCGKLRHNYALCRFTPDSKELILNNGQERISFWNVQAGKESRSLQLAHVSLLSPDARVGVRIEPPKAPERFVGQLTSLDVRTGKETNRLPLVAANNGIENGLAFAPDGKTLAVVHNRKEIQVRDFPSGELRASFPMPDSAKYQVDKQDYWEYRLSFSADGRTVFLGTKTGLVHRWDLASRKELPPLSKHVGAAAGVHVLPDGKTILTTGADGLIRRWDAQTGRQLSEPPGYAGRTHSAYSPDGRIVAVGDERGRLELWNARGGRLLHVLRRDGAAVTKLAFRADGKVLAESRADNAVHFWAVPAGDEQSALHCGKEQDLSYLWDMRFSPDGQRLLIADHNYHARCWDIKGEKALWGGRSGRLAFAPDGKTVLTEFAGPELEVRDAASGKVRNKLRWTRNQPEFLGGISTLAYSPDGQRIAVGIRTGAVYLCDARTGAEITHFQAVDAPKGPFLEPGRKRFGLNVDDLNFSPDSRWLCTSGADGSVRLWEVATGREVLRRSGHRGKATEVSIGADSRTVLSGGEDAQAYLWSLRPLMERGAKPSLDSLWSALAGEPAKAYRALWIMSESKEASAFLRGKLVPVKPVSNERLRKLIADLESDTFAVRERATKAFAELGDRASPAMREALRNKPLLETRKRLEDLIQRVEKKVLSADELRIVRAIDVLERQGSAEARTLLKTLAAGAPGALLTREARAALNR